MELAHLACFFRGLSWWLVIGMSMNIFFPFWIVIDFRARFLLTLWLDRFLAWPSLLFGLTTMINEHPLRSDNKSLHGWSNLAYVVLIFLTNLTLSWLILFSFFLASLCFFVLIASYIPVFVVSKTVPQPVWCLKHVYHQYPVYYCSRLFIIQVSIN